MIKIVFIALAFATLVFAQQTTTSTKNSLSTNRAIDTSNGPSSSPLLWLSSGNEFEEDANAATQRNGGAVEKNNAEIKQISENDITREASDRESNQDNGRTEPLRGKHGPKHHLSGNNDMEEQGPLRNQISHSGETTPLSSEDNDRHESQSFETSSEMDGQSYGAKNKYGEWNPWSFGDISTISQSNEKYIQEAIQTGKDTTDTENIIRLTMDNIVK